MAGEGVTRQLLAKIFNHVIAFGFAVHQHIEFKCFLLFDAKSDFIADGLFIFLCVDIAIAVVAPGLADGRRLRERADSGGRVERQVEPVALYGFAASKRRLPFCHAVINLRHPLFDGRVMHPRGLLARTHSLPAGLQFFGHAVATVIQRLRQGGEFVEFFLSKGQPVFELGVQFGFGPERKRNMQQ